MKKELKEGMGFICETLEDKKRIWQKLTDAGYEMYGDDKHDKQHILFTYDMFITNDYITHPLNESDFFDEWTPKAGEWVEVSDNGDSWQKKQYLCTIEGVHLCVYGGEHFESCAEFSDYKHLRQIKPETMTLQEVREALGKPNLVIEG
jgi:hypothetical protein